MLVELCSLLVVLIHADDIPPQVGLCDLRVDHQQVEHGQYLENNPLLEMHIGDRLERQIPLLSLRFPRGLFNELQSNIAPAVREVVAVEHQDIGVLDAELNLSHVAHAEQALPRPELHQVLPSPSLLLLFLRLLLRLLSKDALASGKNRLQTLCCKFS